MAGKGRRNELTRDLRAKKSQMLLPSFDVSLLALLPSSRLLLGRITRS